MVKAGEDTYKWKSIRYVGKCSNKREAKLLFNFSWSSRLNMNKRIAASKDLVGASWSSGIATRSVSKWEIVV